MSPPPTRSSSVSTTRQLLQATGADAAQPLRPAAPGEPVGDPPQSAPPSPPQPPAPQLENTPPEDIAPLRLAVVRSAAELQAAATDEAQDIEIRAHLDLRPLSRPRNPIIPGFHSDDPANEIRLALLYKHGAMRSMRGNCSDPDAAAALGLSPDLAATLLPLKPRQCLLLLPDTFLFSNGGHFWLDNLYLRLARGRPSPRASFVVAGLTGTLEGYDQVTESTLYVTNATFHGEYRGALKGVTLDKGGSSLLLADCIFTDWVGDDSPLGVYHSSVANVVRTTFRNMRLGAEIADVSEEGIVRFQATALANVTLLHGRVVSTTTNDYATSDSFDLMYYADDDAAFDVELAAVPPNARGVFGEEFRVRLETASDCLYLKAPPGALMPGCPAASVQAREAVVMRDPAAGATGVATRRREEHDDEWDAGQRIEWLLRTEDTPWLQGVRDVLGVLVPAPGWPEFVVPLPAETVMRSGIGLEEGATALPPARGDGPPIVPQLERSAAAVNASAAAVAAAAMRPPAAPIPRGPPSMTLGQGSIAAICTACAVVAVAVAAVLCALCVLRGWCRNLKGDKGSTSAVPGSTVSRRVPGAVSGKITHIPQSAMNPDFEYSLPPQLALLHTSRPSPATCSYTDHLHHHSSSMPLSLRVGAPVTSGHATHMHATIEGTASHVSAYSHATGTAKEHRVGLLSRTEVQRSTGRNQHTCAYGVCWGSGVASSHSSTAPLLRGASTGWSRETLPVSTAADSDTVTGGTIVLSPLTHHEHKPHACGYSPGTSAATTAGGARFSSTDTMTSSSSHHRGRSPYMASSGDGASSADSCMLPGEPALAAALAGHARHAKFGCPRGVRVGWSIGGPLTDGSQSRDRGRPGSSHDHDLDGWRCGEVGSNGEPVLQHTLRQVEVKDASGRHAQLHWDRRMQRLQRQLDAFGEDELFLGRFEMLGREQRRRGGQGLVQFAEGTQDLDFREYAVKFFLDRTSFLTEAALYAAAFPHIRARVSPEVKARADATAHTADGGVGMLNGAVPMAQVVARFLPQVEAVCEGLEDPRGRPLPPCIVMEKGESLHDWSDRAEPDLFTVLAVLSNISMCLADMHDAGYVHRDLKPANVMWLSRQNRWTVTDFGCVARAGEAAALQFTLSYAAPEIAAARRLQLRAIVSGSELDAWSLGVMAFELLTGAPAFDLVAFGSNQVMAMLEGHQPLPWEGSMRAEVRRKLGALQQPVLELLSRDPTRRGSARGFHGACTAVFGSHTAAAARS